MFVETMIPFKCLACSREFESYRSLVSHDNRIHSGAALRGQNNKWCNSCQSYQPKDNFYKLNEGYYSLCKMCSKDKKKEWETTTTKGYNYTHNSNTPRERYYSLISWAKKKGYNISLSKTEYFEIIEKEKCSYCQQGFQGVVFIDIIQPNIGLTIGNILKSCAICTCKKKYNLK